VSSSVTSTTKNKVSFRPLTDPELARAIDDLRFRPITKDELGEFLKVSQRTVDSWIAKRKVPFIRISPRMIRFKLADVEKALSRYTVKEVSLS
jgi:excisionase family DNA binding protein